MPPIFLYPSVLDPPSLFIHILSCITPSSIPFLLQFRLTYQVVHLSSSWYPACVAVVVPTSLSLSFLCFSNLDIFVKNSITSIRIIKRSKCFIYHEQEASHHLSKKLSVAYLHMYAEKLAASKILSHLVTLCFHQEGLLPFNHLPRSLFTSRHFHPSSQTILPSHICFHFHF